MSKVTEWFWNEEFWLPGNTTWDDLRDTKDAKFPHPWHLYMVIPYSLALYTIRIFIEAFFARPIGIWLGISDRPCKRPENNIILEKVFETTTTYPQGETLLGLCKQLDWSEYKVLKWFRRRRDINRPSKLVRFEETVWRFFLYSFLFALGNLTLYHSCPSCLTNTTMLWYGYPEKHQLNSYFYWYYLIEFSFYSSCIVLQFFDVKRHDFWAMFIHHIATIILISASYSSNLVNSGAVIMVLHDFSDVFLELSKMANYAKLDTMGTVGLATFGIVFGVARLIYFPFWVLRSFYFSWMIIGWYHMWFVLCAGLTLLQCLHIWWFTFIVKGFLRLFQQAGPVDDERSDSDVSNTETNVTSKRTSIGTPLTDASRAGSLSQASRAGSLSHDAYIHATIIAANEALTLRNSESQHNGSQTPDAE